MRRYRTSASFYVSLSSKTYAIVLHRLESMIIDSQFTCVILIDL